MNRLLDSGAYLFDEPLIFEIIVKDPKTGTPLFSLAERELEPGSAITAEYPQAGIKVTTV